MRPTLEQLQRYRQLANAGLGAEANADWVQWCRSALSRAWEPSFQRIDFNRSLTLYGSVRAAIDDPAMLKLADHMQMPQLRTAATPLGAEFSLVLSAPDARLLSLFIQSSPWSADLGDTLQCLSCDDTGDLLTGWMSVERFVGFTIAVGEEVYLRDIADHINLQLNVWQAQNIDEVYFDWYVKT